MIDETHDPQLRSWVESANDLECDFPIQNLPLGVFQKYGAVTPAIGIAIGDFILDVSSWLSGASLNEYCSYSRADRRELRGTWSKLLALGSVRRELLHRDDCQMLLPAQIGDYTDFYASIHHATNVGKLFRPDQPLFPNYQHVPIAYHGRASSIVVSGTEVHRPYGQLGEGKFGPSQELDYELEVAAFLGPGNKLGQPIPITLADEHIVGFCLLNDWSARDIQRWEYQPLGPFLAKSFATTISPWMITLEALEPFRTGPQKHEVEPLPYLRSLEPSDFDITLEVWLQTAFQQHPSKLSVSNFSDMFWTFAQMLAHHTSNGCPIRPGDLIASGTVSGPLSSNRGCLLEITSRGRDPLILPGGERRKFLENGDLITLRGFCRRTGFRNIGLGECGGLVIESPVYATSYN